MNLIWIFPSPRFLDSRDFQRFLILDSSDCELNLNIPFPEARKWVWAGANDTNGRVTVGIDKEEPAAGTPFKLIVDVSSVLCFPPKKRMINIIQSGTFSLLYVLFPTKKVGDGCRGEGVNQNNSNWGRQASVAYDFISVYGVVLWFPLIIIN